MVAVGAWSAQLGGGAMYFVPAGFVCAMAVGGTLGFERLVVPGTEAGIALSVLLVGIAICCERRVALPFATGHRAVARIASRELSSDSSSFSAVPTAAARTRSALRYTSSVRLPRTTRYSRAPTTAPAYSRTSHGSFPRHRE